MPRSLPNSLASYVVEHSGREQRNCSFHNTSCCQFLVTGARTAEALRLAIPFEPSLSGFLPLSLPCLPLGGISSADEVYPYGSDSVMICCLIR